MRDKLTYFLLGILFTVLSGVLVAYVIHEPAISYEFVSDTERLKMESLLKAARIPYAYEVDHLGRHWVSPKVSNLGELESVNNDFKIWKESRAN